MEQDIVPGLLEVITKDFDAKTLASPKIKQAMKLLKEKKATYVTANEFAIETGEILAKVFGEKITTEILPDGKMYFNIADRLLNTTLNNNFELVSGFATDVQKELNDAAEIGLKVQVPEINQDRIDGMVNRIASENSFDEIKWLLQEPIVNFTQSIVDDTLKKNADFQAKAGLNPTIERTLVGHGCKWCRSLAGTYDYQTAPKDVFRRHERCRCIVDYDPGTGKRQNVHTKKLSAKSNDAKIEARKTINVSNSSERLSRHLKMNLTFFSEKDIKNQTVTSLQRGIRKYEKQIASHKLKIDNPEKYVSDWNNRHKGYQKGIVKHWNKEIVNFNKSIRDRKDEIKRRGD